jgi:hypothetical protein
MKRQFISITLGLSMLLAVLGTAPLSATNDPLAFNSPLAMSSPFDDEFSSPTLDSKWHWIREDPTHWSLTASPGYLRIITQRRDIWRDNNSAPLLLQSLQALSSSTLVIQTRIVIAPVANYHQGGLVFYDDDDNFVRLTYAYINGLGFEFGKETGGDFQRILVSAPLGIDGFHLRIVKRDMSYYGYYSQDGENWTLIGVHENVEISPSEIGLLAFNGEDVTSIEIPADFDYFRVTSACQLPFFSQRDEEWEDHALRGTCTGWCIDPDLGFVTIGRCGCTLTSAAMVFKAYGADTDPPQLSDCMNTSACPFSWATSISCSDGAVNSVSRLDFGWDRLDQELNEQHRPVILKLCKKGTCPLDYDDDPDTHATTHWVVLVSGQGTDPEYYLMHDPWYKCGANIPLATRSEHWEFDLMRVYEGTTPCSSLEAPTPPCVARGANPQPVQPGTSALNLEPLPSTTSYTPIEIAAPSVISGTVWLYTRTQLTMTVEITAASSVGTISDMLIWSDTMTNTTWQPFTPFVWLPVSEFVYARFRDNEGNTTDVYSDTINPAGPPTAPHYQVFLPLVRR